LDKRGNSILDLPSGDNKRDLCMEKPQRNLDVRKKEVGKRGRQENRKTGFGV